MGDGKKPVHTYAEYLALERASDTRHEFIDGEILAMSGGTPTHALLAMRIGRALDLGAGPCEVYTSDLRVRVAATGRATYADLTVVCGPLACHPEDPDAVTNPSALFEVLSPSTERDDRGEKFAQYRRIPSLRDYVLVAQDKVRIEHFRRQGDGSWALVEHGAGERVELSIGVSFAVDEVYRGGLGEG
jgi:Uma2 family endonuclease